MKKLSTVTVILMSFLLSINHSVFASNNDILLYSSALYGLPPALNGANVRSTISINGLNGIDDIAGSFLDTNNNGVVDAVQIDLFDNGAPQGSEVHEFAVTTVNEVRLLSFPVIESNNFNLDSSDFLESLPAAATPMIPLTDDNRFELTLASGATIFAFDIEVEAVEDDDGGGEPPPPFNINLGLAGAWFNSNNPGQGYMIDLLVDEQFIFIAWFTFTPTGELQWYTAGGNFQGNRAEMNLIQTNNGLFNQPTDVENVIVGNVIIEFTNCLNGTVDFNIPTLGLTGVIPISRIAGDQICQSLADGELILP